MIAGASVWGRCLLKPAGPLLLLGGTGPALQLARVLSVRGYNLIYSIAGRVRQPDLACTVLSGGFTSFGGMAQFVREHKVRLIIDATHPYAAQISQQAALAAEACRLPCWRLQRPAWQAVDGDRWSEFAAWDALLLALRPYSRVFLSQGQLSTQQLAQLSAQRQPGQQFYLRTARPTALALPPWISPLQAIGPFAYAAEKTLLQRLGIDVLVSKNSGGDMTAGKLRAARELGIAVLLLQRPTLPPVARVFSERDELVLALTEEHAA